MSYGSTMSKRNETQSFDSLTKQFSLMTLGAHYTIKNHLFVSKHYLSAHYLLFEVPPCDQFSSIRARGVSLEDTIRPILFQEGLSTRSCLEQCCH